jgi:hypothetical protein
MKVIGKVNKRVINEDGNLELTLEINNLYHQEQIKELKKDVDYRIEIEEVKSTRSIYQNNLMWKIIHDIAIARGGDRASGDDWNIYLEALERAGARFEYIALLPQAEDILKKQFRAIKLMNSFEHKGKTFNQYKVYYGSSKLNNKEMSLLLEMVKDIAVESGVDISVYE